MKIFVGPEFIDEALHSFAEARMRRKGILRREPREIFQIGKILMRSFRRVEFFDSDSNLISTSLIDDEFTSLVNSIEETILLWRPRYVDLLLEDVAFGFSESKTYNEKLESLQAIVNDFLGVRKTAQNNLLELKDEIADIQNNWRSTASLLLPRSPSTLMKQEEVAKAKRHSDGIIRATSLVMNCSDSSSVEYAVLGESALVETTLIEFHDLEKESDRIVALENPSAESIDDALSKGRALTRLLEINGKCREMLINTIFD